MLFRKTVLAVSTTVLMCSAAMADENVDRQTMSLGYQRGHIKDFGDIQGGNFKFQYESSTPWGVMGSLTAMKKDWDNDITLWNSKSKRGKTKNVTETKRPVRNAQYFSAMIGPTYRVSNNLSFFVLGGMSHSKVDKPLIRGLADSSLKKNGSESSNQFAYSAGVTLNATDNLAITIGYEGSQAGFASKKHEMKSVFLDVGYRF